MFFNFIAAHNLVMKALWRQQLKMENLKSKLYLRPQKFVILVTKV